MQKFHRKITQERVEKFTSDRYFADVNLTSKLYKARTELGIELHCFRVPELKRIPFNEAIAAKPYLPAKLGDSFGPSWATVWFHVKVKVDREWQVALRDGLVQLLWDCDNEGMVWTVGGEPLQAFTGGTGCDRRVDLILTDRLKVKDDALQFEFYIEVACNGMFGTGEPDAIRPPRADKQFQLKTCELVIVNQESWDLFYDYEVIAAMAKELPEQSQRAAEALMAANSIVNAFDRDDNDALIAAKKIASAFLKQHAGSDSIHRVTTIGMCHIDTAWLWPYDETKRKCARSWSTQLDLMRRYPEFKFACSQAQQFDWVQQNYPQLFQEIQKYVKAGQFLPVGGTWVEMDCNIPSGESFVRQFLYGQRYYESAFGKRTQVFWLPDTFGYAAQLPQIIKQSDMKYFLTQKLSWNNINKFPHTTFYWIGLDGTEVLTHFPPADSYCSQARVHEVLYAEKNHKDKLVSNESMYVIGNGDGGGGPLSSMLERTRRMANVAGLPKVDFGDPTEFFDRIQQCEDAKQRPETKMTKWRGELYFELHRGTYTSQAKVKWYNRKLEIMLQQVEFLYSSLLISDKSSLYPQAELERLWKVVLLNQFHDVLPGSSIEMVYDDAHRLYAEVETELINLRNRAVDLISARSTSSGREEPSALVVNDLSFARRELVEVGTELVIVDARPLSHQMINLKAAKCEDQVFVTETSTQITLQNKFVKALFSNTGKLESFYDLENEREYISEAGNRLMIFEDVPLFWDAWDVEVYHLEKGKEVQYGSAKVSEAHALRCSITVEHPITKTSTLRQTISLCAHSSVLTFDTEVEWNENRQILKVQFPFNIKSDIATYETAFGWVQRPTHFNTSWDLAKFEVCGHKFADLSEFGAGIALLNDCKYGYSCHDNVMSLSLLRAPKAPDANCDIGKRHFKYALYPHQGTFSESNVVQEGLKFNNPLLVHPVKAPSDFTVQEYFSVSARNVILDTVKKAEDSNDLILRLYEAYGGRGKVEIKSHMPIKKVALCNLLEDELLQPVHLSSDNKTITISYTPFQIISLKVSFTQ